MPTRGVIVVLAVILTGLTIVSVAGHGPFAGHYILKISSDHGLNQGDVPVLMAWLAGLGCCAWLWRRA